MTLRLLHGHLWECHSETRYRLVGRPFWIERDARGWFARADGRDLRADFSSLDEGMQYVAEAFERYGEAPPAA